ncbi:hypothetical protein CRUP_019578 [Coryphaenoides rupestris]|nr:hypothetical protein CRUP_019578 [Coryphaenoides rupestris]
MTEVVCYRVPLGPRGHLEVEFRWPLESTSGKWLLYLMEVRLDGTSEPHCVAPGNIINPLNLTDCEDGSARCVVFTCRLSNMKTTSSLSLTANAWSPTLLEDYSDAWSVNVKGQATLKLHTEKPSPIRMSPQTLQLSVLLLPDVGEGTAGAPLWILICSALSGLFLLSIICLLLRRRAGPWRGVSLHQGKIMGKEESHTDDFLIQTDRRRQWITSWTDSPDHLVT